VKLLSWALLHCVGAEKRKRACRGKMHGNGECLL